MEEALMSGPSYRVSYRRRRQGKTDFHARRALVLSGLPRFVVRDSLRYVTVQIAEAQPMGDKIISSAYSRELSKAYGWQGSCSNIPSAYLTGFLCGLRAVGMGVRKAILDVGLQSPTKGSKIFAAVKGAVDAGLEVPCDQEKLPDENRIKGQHIADYAKQLAENQQETYTKQFSQYLAAKLSPEELPEHFTQIKEKIQESFKPTAGKKEKPKPKAKPQKVKKEKAPAAKEEKTKPKARAKRRTTKKPRKTKKEEKMEE